jgi:hypothetical protein
VRAIRKAARRAGATTDDSKQKGSHVRWTVTASDGSTASTAVAMHPRALAVGTLAKIEKDLAPVLGKGWLDR